MTQTPKLEEIIEHAVGDRLERFPTALPAKVISFNPRTHSCELEIEVNNAFEDSTGKKIHQRAKVVNIPVVFPGSGSNRILFQVSPGDWMLYIVSSLPLGDWITTAAAKDLDVPHEARNNISCGFAIPGLLPYNRVFGSAPTDDVMVLSGDIKLGSDNATDNVVTRGALSGFMVALDTLILAGDPTHVFTALRTALNNIFWDTNYAASTKAI